MLPKVATHILHHTSRAVTAVQNQTGYTIRNVLQLQTQGSGTPATTGNGLGGYGSSNWGSTGAGPGGAKYHAGSRFYSGYSVSTTSMLSISISYMVSPLAKTGRVAMSTRAQVFQCTLEILFSHILAVLKFHSLTFVS